MRRQTRRLLRSLEAQHFVRAIAKLNAVEVRRLLAAAQVMHASNEARRQGKRT